MKNPKDLHFDYRQPELFIREDETDRVNEELVRFEGDDLCEIL